MTGRASNLRAAIQEAKEGLVEFQVERVADGEGWSPAEHSALAKVRGILSAALRADDDARADAEGEPPDGPLGPTPAEAREITDTLCQTLMQISCTPRRGGPATLGAARRIAYEVARDLPRLYLIRPQHWVRRGS